MMSRTLDITVIVATYRRPDRLAECLAGIREQTRAADEVLVVATSWDDESARCISELADGWPELRSPKSERNGTVTAYNRGLQEARGEIVAFVDDDAVPVPDWLERIERTFAADERIAAVGGKDIISGEADDGGVGARLGALRGQIAVGRIQWFGRMISNHHLGSGSPQDVDVLKGVNMSFRRSAVSAFGFDERIWGDGAQVHSELSICLPLRRQGLRVIYDPGIVVMHHPAPRLAGAKREEMSAQAVRNSAHNEALALIDYFGPGRGLIFATWAMVIGNSESPGLAVFARDVVKKKPVPLRRLVAAQHGRLAAWRTRSQRRSGAVRDRHVSADPLETLAVHALPQQRSETSG